MRLGELEMGEKGWREIPIGGVVPEPGSTMEYETGAWRISRPIIDLKKCVNCMICWIHCPDGSIRVEEGKVVDIDLKHCKGCGICARECPSRAIEMVEERKARETGG